MRQPSFISNIEKNSPFFLTSTLKNAQPLNQTIAQTSGMSVFLDFFGQRPQSNVLDFLLENRIFGYGKNEIAAHSRVGITNLGLLWDRLVSHGIIVETRKVGRSPRYALNAESPLIKQLIKLDLELTFVESPGNNPGKAALSVG